MKTKNLFIFLSLAGSTLLGGCSTSPYLFDGHHVVYKTDPILIRKSVIAEDAAKRCASVHKRAKYLRRSCVTGGGDCTTTYVCE